MKMFAALCLITSLAFASVDSVKVEKYFPKNDSTLIKNDSCLIKGRKVFDSLVKIHPEIKLDTSKKISIDSLRKISVERRDSIFKSVPDSIKVKILKRVKELDSLHIKLREFKFKRDSLRTVYRKK